MKRSSDFYSGRHMRRKKRYEMERSWQQIQSRFSAKQSSSTPNTHVKETDTDTEDEARVKKPSIREKNIISSYPIDLKDSPKNLNELNFDKTKNNSLELNKHLFDVSTLQNFDSYKIVNTNDTVEPSDNLCMLNCNATDITLDENLIFEECCYRYSDDEDNSDFDETFESNDGISQVTEDQNSKLQGYVDNLENNVSKEKVSDILQSISSSLRNIITKWTVNCSIPQIHISKLLHSIREEIPVISLPLDPRTLVKTPRKTEIFEITNGYYCHFGVKKCIEAIIKKRLQCNITDKNINLIINMDGAPLGKSSVKNLWPILCSEKDITDVFIIGVYCGEGKPGDANEFLKPFVTEISELVNSGITYNEIHYAVNLYSIVCDAPAKAFILGVKYHSGYDCCSKCTIEGTMYRCVCFPGKVAELRTDEKFKQNAYKDDYQKNETILNDIPKLGLVTSVPLDPMHLIYLGCTRKLLLMWLCSSNMHKLPQIKQDMISDHLVSIQKYISCDFARKPRPLKYIKLFKATEFRLFLLYTGVVVLKDHVTHDVYVNFVTLHVVITILSSLKLHEDQSYLDYADKLLCTFVEHFQSIYGPQFVTYNVHNLQHLTSDARKYGTLDTFSAFRFENFICQMKKLLRKGNQPLQQLMRRCAEIEIVQDKIIHGKNIKNIIFKMPHTQGPLIDHFPKFSQYKVVELKTLKLSCTDDKNNCILIDDKIVITALNFIQYEESKEVYIIGKKMRIIGNLYECPLPSSQIGISIVCNTNSDIEAWNLTRITSKLLKIPYKKNFVIFPIIHTSSPIND